MTIETKLSEIRIHHATKTKALKLEAMLTAEYPTLSLDVSVVDGIVSGWTVYAGDEPVLDTPKVPDLAEILDACEDQGIDPTEGVEEEEEEPKLSGSVVPEQYRARYREVSSNGQSCGDWLAEWLVGETNSGDALDVEGLTRIFQRNDVLRGKWSQLPYSGQRGWQGRFRMNGRQALEQAIALTGDLRDAEGQGVAIPYDVLVGLQTKHAKAITKARRAQEAADKAAAEEIQAVKDESEANAA